jgi:hypothetical protein
MLPNASQIVIPWAVVQVHDTPLLSVLQFHGQSSGHVQPTAGVDPSGHGTLVVPLRLAHAVVASTTERAVIHRSRIVRAVIASSSFLLVSGCCSRIGQVVLVDPVCPPPPDGLSRVISLISDIRAWFWWCIPRHHVFVCTIMHDRINISVRMDRPKEPSQRHQT